jgi:hypothetical protein
MTKEIILPSGHVCLVDDEDFGELSKHKWHIDNKGYARREAGKKHIFMHKEILRTRDGLWRDHINGNRLDNRKCNLRFVTAQQNAQNRSKGKSGSSQYKGVIREQNKYWRAKIKQIWLGYFKTEEDAAQAYDEAAKEKYGEYARLNFPHP